jgi:hypothetical protein
MSSRPIIMRWSEGNYTIFDLPDGTKELIVIDVSWRHPSHVVTERVLDIKALDALRADHEMWAERALQFLQVLRAEERVD